MDSNLEFGVLEFWIGVSWKKEIKKRSIMRNNGKRKNNNNCRCASNELLMNVDLGSFLVGWEGEYEL